MANPPITVGPFNNVPAPGSPIRSDWPQSVTAWLGRHGCALVQAGQSVPPATQTDFLWPTETYDTDGFHTGTDALVTIPAGMGGLYVFGATVDAGGNVNGPTIVSMLLGASVRFAAHLPSGQRYVSVSGLCEVTAGTASRLVISSGHSTAATFAARLYFHRLSA
jgi:hypothetical protein